jgi:hypothetical protein
MTEEFSLALIERESEISFIGNQTVWRNAEKVGLSNSKNSIPKLRSQLSNRSLPCGSVRRRP